MSNKTITTAETYANFVAYFEEHPVEEIEVCCEDHRKVLIGIVTSKKGITSRQIDFARSIINGEACRSNSYRSTPDLDKIWTITCTHYQCDAKVTGTRIELGQRFNRCDDHLIKRSSK